MNTRQWVSAAVVASLPLLLIVSFGHAGNHMARSVLVPGAGLYGERLGVGLVLTVSAIVATVGWLRWGTDWAVVAVAIVGIVLSGVVTAGAHADETGAMPVRFAAHEFPLVILVISAVAWARSVLRRVPGVNRIRLRPRTTRLGPVDRCRGAAIAAVAGIEVDVADIEAPDVAARSRRIGIVARGRLGGDPFRVDHAPARAALALCGRLDEPQMRRFRDDASASWAGVPCSEPGWARLLDGTLAAVATGDHDRWVEILDGPMRLHRGHRPAWTWTPLRIAAGRADDWEHATATAIAHARGWIGPDDWAAVRQRALGAAARGTAQRADERLIAAGRVWAVLVDDEPATRILRRPTIRHDQIAVALNAYATRLATERIAA